MNEVCSAKITDASILAKLSILAGGGTFELLLQGLKRDVAVHQVMTALAAADNTEYSYKYWLAAAAGDSDEIAGGVNVIPVAKRYELVPNINPILQQQFGFGVLQLIRFLFRARHLKGMNTLKVPKGSLHINDIAVFPQFQGQGIGKKLVQAVIGQAKQNGNSGVSLYVWSDNQRAIKFYHKLGFETAGTASVRPHRYLPHKESTMMILKLT